MSFKMTLQAYKFCAMAKNKRRSEKEPGADVCVQFVQRADFVGFVI